jgi:hypothetical protein
MGDPLPYIGRGVFLWPWGGAFGQGLLRLGLEV